MLFSDLVPSARLCCACAQGYHVWAKLIEACADLGYGPNNLVRNSIPLQAHSKRP